VLPHLALLVGHGTDVLDKANLQTAKSLVAVTDDEMDNLETALTAHAANPSCRLAIRTYDQRFTERVAGLFPYANVLCASALSAEAFVAAAFGEAVLSLFRINHQTVLVTDYTLDETDTLHGLLLSEIAYGYGLVTILHHRVGQEPPVLMPSDDIRARPGDRLIVLATIAGLRRVERGEQLPRRWYVHLEKVWTQDAAFAGATELARVTGCSLRQARETMQQLPIVFPMPLYYQQARRLVRRLKRSQITASSYGGQNPGAP
jgi:Trk K+ transport system NAD-binding subunit